jgi:acylphosphatase
MELERLVLSKPRLSRVRIDVDLGAVFLIDYRAVNETSTQHGPPVHRCTCHFTGRVQGVGFRYTAQNLSLQYDVAGYVRNLSDGRVEVVMEGRDCEMDCFLDSLKQKMNGYIKALDRHVDPPTGEFHRFSIRH